MEKKEAESLSGVFVPDLSDVQEYGHSEWEALYLHYHKAKCLIEGALGVVADSDDCGNCTAAKGLLEAFIETMEKAEEAFDCADARHPVITIEELKEMIGTVGNADVSGIHDRDGYLNMKRFRLEGKPAPAAIKSNGKKQGKAA